MPNLAVVLKQEIARLARRTLRSDVVPTRKTVAQHRREIAGVKRMLAGLAKRLEFLERQERKRVASKAAPTLAEGARFSPRWLKTHRQKLGFSAPDYARLVGVHPMTIYGWEHGRSRPRPEQLATLVELRELRKREAVRRLELLGE